MSPRTRGFPVVIAAPSGAGKTSLARALVDRRDDIVFSLSATTRPPRPGEEHGRDYLFVDDAEFDRMAVAGELAEWAVVHERRYGTPRSVVTEALEKGRIVVLDIDVQGARQVRQSFPEAVLIFIIPPSGEELVRRLTDRRSEGEEERRRRLRTARLELAALPEFDYLVVNDEFEAAVHALESILEAERRRVSRRNGLEEEIRGLDRDIEQLLERSG